MRIAVTRSKSGKFLNLLKAGIIAAGHTPILVLKRNHISRMEGCDCAATFGFNVNNGTCRKTIYEAAKKYNKPVVFFDAALFDDLRGEYSMITVDGPKGAGLGYIKEVETENSRWIQHFADKITVKDWKIQGGLCTILLHNMLGYRIVSRSCKKQNADIKHISQSIIDVGWQFRKSSHPKQGVSKTLSWEVIEQSKCCFGWHTNALTNAAIRGIPVITNDKESLAYDIASHSIGSIITPDRQAWLNKMSWITWSVEEIKKGEPWELIEQYITSQIQDKIK